MNVAHEWDGFQVITQVDRLKAEGLSWPIMCDHPRLLIRATLQPSASKPGSCYEEF